MLNDFAVFICTHGRPDVQITHDTLLGAGYTGKIIFVVDDEDNTVEALKANYPVIQVMQFNKQAMIDISPTVSFPPIRKTILYAKNACEAFAKELGLTSFVIADDDLTSFRYRYVDGDSIKSLRITRNFDAVLEAYNEFMLSNNMISLGFGIAQYYFNGVTCMTDNLWKWRIPYTFVFRNASKSLLWQSDYGEDIITSISYATAGEYAMCCPMVQQDTKPLATTAGGMAELHTVVSSFKLSEYGYLYHPTAEKPVYYKDHWMASIKRDKAFPKLVSSIYRKEK